MTTHEEIEQLKTILAQTADEQAQAELLLELMSKYATIRSVDLKPFADRLTQLAAKVDSARYRAWGLYYGSIYDRLTGKKEDAMNLCRQALLLFEQVNDLDGIARAYNNMAGIQQELGNYAEGLKDHLRGLEIREKIGDKTGIGNTYNHIGVNHFLQGNFQEALKYIYLAFEIRKELGNKLDLAHSYNNMTGLVPVRKAS